MTYENLDYLPDDRSELVAEIARLQKRVEELERMPANPLAYFVAAGWKFDYDEATRFVVASHPLGGKFSICEVARFARSGGENPVTFHEVGHAIAAWLSTPMD